MYKYFVYFAIAFQVIGYSYGYTEDQASAILARFGPAFQDCVNEAEVTQLDVEIAVRDRNINSIPACYFSCVLERLDLYKEIFGKKAINVIEVRKLLPELIPTIKNPNFLIDFELIRCAIGFFFTPGGDNFPFCGKTRVFTNCLSGARFLNNAIKRAIEIQ